MRFYTASANSGHYDGPFYWGQATRIARWMTATQRIQALLDAIWIAALQSEK